MTCLGQTTLLLFEEYTAERFTSLRTNSSSVCKAYYVNFFILFLAYSSSPVHFNHRLSLTRNTTTAANHGKGTFYKVLSSPYEDNVRLKDSRATWTHESRICPLYTTCTYALQELAKEQMNLNKCTLNNSRMQFLAHQRIPPVDNSWMNEKLSKLLAGRHRSALSFEKGESESVLWMRRLRGSRKSFEWAFISKSSR